EVVPVNDLHSRPLPFYADRHLIYFDTGMVPAGGYKVYRAVPTKEFNRKAVFWAEMRKSTGSNIVKVDNVLENDYLKVEVQNNGTINVLQKEQNRLYKELNYFEDSGDNGDYWMYYPPHHNRTFTSKGLQARIWVADNGPLSATVAAEIKMLLPAHALRPENEIRGESRRADEEKELTATVYYTLKRDSRKVDIKLVLNNTIEDHRFRVMFDTGIKARNANAAGHFTVDKRPVAPVKDAQGEYWPEMQTLPQQNFVDLDDGKHGFAVVNNCLTEYEAMDNDRGTLALTLLRGVRNIICTEFRSAGVFPRQKGGQSLGMHCYEYSIYPHKEDWVQASVYREAASLNVPLKPVQTSRNEKGCLGLKNSFYSIEPANLIMSALKKAEDRESIILRVFNPTNKTIDGIIKFYSKISKAWLTNMNEERMEELKPVNADKLEIKAGPNKILTLELEVGEKSNV
ncbi:glycoside hydrolase family 38 C-terminal domain-containing protein, partial [Ruminiclostridium cellobioparum]